MRRMLTRLSRAIGFVGCSSFQTKTPEENSAGSGASLFQTTVQHMMTSCQRGLFYPAEFSESSSWIDASVMGEYSEALEPDQCDVGGYVIVHWDNTVWSR